MMKIFILQMNVGNCCEPDDPDYKTFVVSAEDEQEAREIAKNNENESGLANFWMYSSETSCYEIQPSGCAGVILSL